MTQYGSGEWFQRGASKPSMPDQPHRPREGNSQAGRAVPISDPPPRYPGTVPHPHYGQGIHRTLAPPPPPPGSIQVLVDPDPFRSTYYDLALREPMNFSQLVARTAGMGILHGLVHTLGMMAKYFILGGRLESQVRQLPSLIQIRVDE
jgi:hypothetical protein